MNVGDRVEMTEAGVRQHLHGKRDCRTGVVVGTPRLGPEYVTVLRDGYQRPERFHASFWRVVAPVIDVRGCEEDD
jgi:hypothetical protein